MLNLRIPVLTVLQVPLQLARLPKTSLLPRCGKIRMAMELWKMEKAAFLA